MNYQFTPEEIETQKQALVCPVEIACQSISACLQFRSKADATKQVAIQAIKKAKEIYGEEDAGKKVRALLVSKYGFDKRRVSEVLIEFGIRARAASKKKDETQADLSAAIELLVQQAQEIAGEHAKIALRRAYLKLQGQENA